jgi:cytidylate kinase
MAIITISRGCFSHGKQIAECVAQKLGYECISQEILLEASEVFQVPETKIFESLHDAPGLLERLTHARQHFIDSFQAMLLERVAKDRVVYHGFAGQIFLGDISHVLRVRVNANMEGRIKLLQSRQQLDREEAQRHIEREDQVRAEWYRTFYRIDMHDPSLYDMVLNIDRLSINDACDIISRTALKDSFKATPKSQAALADLALEDHVKVLLEGMCKADVKCRQGIVYIRVAGQKLKASGMTSPDVQHQVQDQIREDVFEEIVSLVSKVPGVKDINCSIDTPYYV